MGAISITSAVSVKVNALLCQNHLAGKGLVSTADTVEIDSAGNGLIIVIVAIPHSFMAAGEEISI